MRRETLVFEILFVCEDENGGVEQVFVVEAAVEQHFGLGEPLHVRGVDDENDAVDLVEVVLPKPRGLPTDVPQGEVGVFELHLLHIQSDRRHRVLEFVVAHLEQQRALACVVQAQEQHFFVVFWVIACG